MQQVRVIDAGLVKVIVSLHTCGSGKSKMAKPSIIQNMEEQYQKRIDQCFNAYKDIILSQAEHPGDEEYDMWEAMIVSDLERAIEAKVRRQLLLDLRAYLSNELPF